MTDIVKIQNLPEQYNDILKNIEKSLPIATKHTEIFNKSSSQFKTATLDVVDLTPINSAKHLLAVIQRTRQALEEATINLRRKTLKLSKKQDKLNNAISEYDKEKLIIDIDELNIQISNIEDAIRGALRKLSHALNQYQKILDKLGVDHLTEEDYEKDQIKYHIMTAFNQALTAARSRGGLIDEGNHIYLMQLGINGAMAQAEVTSFLQIEQDLLNRKVSPSHDLIINWLEALAEKYQYAPKEYSNMRGFDIIDINTLISLESE